MYCKSERLKWFNLIFFFFLVFLIFHFQFNAWWVFDIFTERDIQRALGWLNGRFYWPGPEMSYGFNLPGPFFYFLLFPPLIFGDNIYSQSLIWHITWLSLTYTIAFHFAGKIYRYKESLLIFIMFFISCIGQSLFMTLGFAWNPSFALMFHVLAVITLYYWKETNRNSYLYLLGLIIGFGVQVHFLVSIHLLTALFLYFFERKKRWKPVVLFIALIFLPCLPYFLMYGFNALEVSNYSTEILTTRLIKKIFQKNGIGLFTA